ncbi:hypothetical protein L1987_47612 [Smallanthus sonchifolius]|uniref:Uncharacterized protein n=1 Tax=Smallanthus sonchifolius TaxID=185202 RepID=A0ACB9G2P7_9ASTR|nr:hypothetical protein L1987_47612 [Smallanthus sonchifolius]
MRRIEIIKRKRNAMQKFLRNDVADLLKNSLHSNAYDRVEQLFADQNLSWCYEFVEQSCLLIISQLSAMSKQRECPEECKEAIPTLMFAAARFADLPELRELRSLFSERFGNDLEPYVNHEFVKNLKTNIPTKEIKLHMMQKIAMEYGIKWDSKDWSQYGNGRNNESYKTLNQNSSETKYKETEKKKTEVAMDHTLKNGLPYNSRAEIEKEQKTIGNALPYKSRAEIDAQKEGKHDHGHQSPCWSSNTSTYSETTSPDDSASEDIPEGRRCYEFRSTGQTNKSTISDTTISGGKDDNFQSDIPKGRKLNGLRSMGPPYIKPDSRKKTVGPNFKDDDHKSVKESEKISKPVPRSVRVRRPLKTVSGSSRGNNDVSNGESHDLDNGYRDEQEKKMDKHLSHYSRKASQLPATTRTGSLPCEPVAAGVVVDERKGLARAATYQLESGLGSRGNVHPKLPDYDDFVARLAALRASS